jgi:hypothetical protein
VVITINFSLTERDVTIKKVREFINKLESLGVDENLQLEGYLDHIVAVEPMEIGNIGCSDCDPYTNNNDWIVTAHDCNSKWNNRINKMEDLSK